MWILYGLCAGVVLGLYDVWTKKAMTANNVIPVVMWSSLFGALFWAPLVATNFDYFAMHIGDVFSP
jgi:drug/metabolite transporter (DMT)-like permease